MNFTEAVLESGVRLLVPILFVALGEQISERSGILNIGLEGMMVAGGYTGYRVMVATGDPVLATGVAALAGAAVALVMVIACVWNRSNQVLVGFSLFILVPGLMAFLHVESGITEGLPAMTIYEVPLLSDLPIVGQALFAQNGYYYFLAACVALVGWMFAKTTLGLRITAVGHNPEAASSMHINVHWTRTIAVMACGALAGIGGASLTVGAIGAYSPGVTNGRGFVAIAVVILGRWTVKGTVLAAAAIGGFFALQLRLGQVTDIPVQLLAALPWVVVLIMLIAGVRQKSNAPRALAQS